MKYRFIIACFLCIVLFTSCPALFSNNVFESLQQDIADLPDSRKPAYAEDILASGNKDKIAIAYAEIAQLVQRSPDDAALQILAARLSLALISDSFLEDADLEDFEDPSLLEAVGEYVNTALDLGASVPDKVLVNAAFVQLFLLVGNDYNLTALFSWDPSTGPLDLPGDTQPQTGINSLTRFLASLQKYGSEIIDLLFGLFELDAS